MNALKLLKIFLKKNGKININNLYILKPHLALFVVILKRCQISK
jgi:hypothetical protein